jgi:hypothetical protein
MKVTQLGCLRGESVFVDHSAEQVTAADPVAFDHVARWFFVARRPLAERWPLLECRV